MNQPVFAEHSLCMQYRVCGNVEDWKKRNMKMQEIGVLCSSWKNKKSEQGCKTEIYGIIQGFSCHSGDPEWEHHRAGA